MRLKLKELASISINQIDVLRFFLLIFLLLLNGNFMRLNDFVSIHRHKVWIPCILFLSFHQLSLIFVNFNKFTTFDYGVCISSDIFVTMVKRIARRVIMQSEPLMLLGLHFHALNSLEVDVTK